MTLENKLQKTTTQTVVTRKQDTFAALLESNKDAISRALPAHMTADRMLRTALTAIRINPSLQECTSASIIAGVMQSAQLGLDIGVLGRAYLVPYRNKQGGYDAQFQVGYKGLIDLIRRSGDVSFVSAHAVYANDIFSLKYGMEEKLEHIPYFALDKDEPGPMKGAYAVAKMKDGSHSFTYMTKKEIDAIRSRSKAGTDGPWVTDYEAMSLKTVIKRLSRTLPMSVESAVAISADETVKTKFEENLAELPDESDVVTVEPAPISEKVIETPKERKPRTPKPEPAPVVDAEPVTEPAPTAPMSKLAEPVADDINPFAIVAGHLGMPTKTKAVMAASKNGWTPAVIRTTWSQAVESTQNEREAAMKFVELCEKGQ